MEVSGAEQVVMRGHGKPAAEPWPRRSQALIAAICFSFLAVHGSLLPYEFEPHPLGRATNRFLELEWARPRIDHLVDWGTNLALFLPISFFGAISLGWRARGATCRMLTAAMVVGGCLTLSVSIEFAQLFITARVPSSDDVYAQALGTLGGVLAAVILGPGLVETCQRRFAAQSPETSAHRLLHIYLIGLLLYALAPYDFSVHPVDLYRQYQAGAVELTPAAGWLSSSAHVPYTLANLALFIPVGCWANGALRAQQYRRAAAYPLLLGCTCAAAIEGMQLFVGSRVSTTSDVVTGAVGTMLGIGIGKAISPSVAKSGLDRETDRASGFSLNRLWVVATVAYAALLCAVFWWPLDLNPKRHATQADAAGFFMVPLHAMLHKSPPEALEQVLFKVGMFVPLGLCAGMIPCLSKETPALRRWATTLSATACIVLATLLELVQTVFPPHIPDISDVFLYTGGAAVGLTIIYQATGPQRSLTKAHITCCSITSPSCHSRHSEQLR